MSLERRIQTRTSSPALPADFIALSTVVLTTVMTVMTVAILYFLREVFIPLALAILLSFVLAPAMRVLTRMHVPRSAAAITVVLAAFAAIFGLGTVMVSSVQMLAQDLPRYQSELQGKIKSVKSLTAGSHTLDQAADILHDLGNQLKTTTPKAEDRVAPKPQQPMPVVIREPDSGPLGTVTAFIAPLLSPLATTGVIIVFVIFILVQRKDLRDRLIRLTGTRDLGRTTAAIDDAARRLSRFYLVQLALNSGFGICIGCGLWLIGVPSPATWGILAAVLRFVPYIGSFISAVLPLAIAAAVEPGWTKAIETLALFGIIETIVGQVIEPLLYGHSTGLSPIAVVIAATFWTWLWGPIGLVLATPLTVCLVVLGRHVERLRFLEVLFGDRPALSPPEIFYQRMLAGDPAEAADHAEQFLKKRALLTYYEGVALAGLRLAQSDLDRGLLDREQIETIAAAATEVVGDLDEADDARPSGNSGQDPETEAALEAAPDSDLQALPVISETDGITPAAGTAVCIAGQSELDEVAGRFLAQVLVRHGLPCEVLPASSLRTASLFRLDLSRARWICLSFMDAGSAAHVRQAVKKLRRKAPNAAITIGAWTALDDAVRTLNDDTQATTVTTLRQAAELALESTRHPAPAPALAEPMRDAV